MLSFKSYDLKIKKGREGEEKKVSGNDEDEGDDNYFVELALIQYLSGAEKKIHTFLTCRI
jgi:hypothetical protein